MHPDLKAPEALTEPSSASAPPKETRHFSIRKDPPAVSVWRCPGYPMFIIRQPTAPRSEAGELWGD